MTGTTPARGGRLGLRRPAPVWLTLRAAPGLWPVVCGTVLVGAGITVGNVLVPGVVKQEFAGSEGLVTRAVHGRP